MYWIKVKEWKKKGETKLPNDNFYFTHELILSMHFTQTLHITIKKI